MLISNSGKLQNYIQEVVYMPLCQDSLLPYCYDGVLTGFTGPLWPSVNTHKHS